KKLFDAELARLLRENPGMTKEEAEAETSKWVSPYKNNVPVHATGAAIDIHLFHKKTKTFIDMGPFNRSGDLAPTFTTDHRLSICQASNRLLMLIAATRAG